MGCYLGIDTSNYTTSTALFDHQTGVKQNKQLLPVPQGGLGLRQGDAVFHHVRQLGPLLEELLQGAEPVLGVGVSVSPRDEEGSYMPCFLAGEMAARSVAAALGVALHTFSHQAGHVMAALYGAERMDLVGRRFLAFHLSGGTTEGLLVEPDRDKVLGVTTVARTLDLNAGQVVDRVGRLLGLPFPAGPQLELLAEGSGASFAPKPTIKGTDCCLSGLENQCGKLLEQGAPPQDVAKFCLESLAAALLAMTEQVLRLHPGLPLIYAGGVMSNRLIRGRVLSRFQAGFAPPELSADNGAGIALLCSHKCGEKGEAR